MKKIIEIEQIKSLSDNQIEKLKQLWNPDYGDIYINVNNECERDIVKSDFSKEIEHIPLFNIGQMIENIKVDHIPYDIWECSSDADFCDQIWKCFVSECLI